MRNRRGVLRRLAVLLMLVAASSGLGVFVGLSVGTGIDLRSGTHERVAPYDIRLSGSRLEEDMGRQLAAVNAQRAARHDHTIAKDVLVEYVTFERSAGGVVTRGSLRDLGAPRTLRVVIDAFDSLRNYRASGASAIVTGPGSTQFSAEMADADDYESFGVRFLDGDVEVRKLSKDDPLPGEPPLLMDDLVMVADDGELAQRLASLGYVQDAQDVVNDVVLLAVLQRFRHDHGITGPSAVTIGDLLALRAVSTSVSTSGVDLSAY